MKTKVRMMLLAFIVIFFACKDDDDVNPDEIIPDELAGTWINEVDEPWAGHTTEYYLLSLEKVDSENGLFENIWVADYPEENVLLVLEGSKGTFTVNKNIIYLVTTHFGTQIALDDVTIYDTTMWWGEEDPEFDNFVQEDDAVLFEVNGNTLICTLDEDNNGSFNDEEDETIFFLRED